MRRINILHIASTLNPKYGGPVEGLKILNVAYKKFNISLNVLTLDSKKSLWLKDKLLPKTFAIGPSYFNYKLNFKIWSWLKKNVHRYDFVIIDGVWQFHGLIMWLYSIKFDKPYFVLTHGMLDPWFKKYYFFKHLKKLIYWKLFENKILKKAKAVLFTSKKEKELASIPYRPFSINSEIINHGVVKKNYNQTILKKTFDKLLKNNKEKKIILFLSRIHKKKGCDILIKSFAKSFKNNKNVILVIAGNDKNKYAVQLKKLASNLKLQNIIWTGFVNDIQKWSLLSYSNISCFPSHSENFGTSIVESLSCGTPVIISNKINIYEIIYKYQAGFVGNNNVKDTTINLIKWHTLSSNKKKKLKQNAKKCFESNFNLNIIGKTFRETFEKYIVN
tara:strand:+ start:1544 stop:2710 length:1167 start_codon:yes stop_codon:yes gene_type:complete